MAAADDARVDQISLPYRIALLALLAFGAIYLVVLKPSDEPVSDAPPPAAVSTNPSAPGVNGLSTAADKARAAAAAQAASDAATQAATGAPPAAKATPGATSAAPAAPAAPATPATKADPAGADPSAAILGELAKGQTAVVLFAGSKAADDRAVRAAVGRVDRRGGKVRVHVVPMSKVGAYEAITAGVPVQQSPTILVIGKEQTARVIAGFTTVREIDQLVADVRSGR